MVDSVRTPHTGRTGSGRRPKRPKVGDRWVVAGLGVVEKIPGGLKVVNEAPSTKKMKGSAQRKRSRDRYQALTKGVPKRR